MGKGRAGEVITKRIGSIVGFGEALIDIFSTGEVIGGAPLNFSIRAAELGGPLGYRTAMVTRVGRDQRGSSILERLNQSSLDSEYVQFDPELPTGTVHIRLVNGQPEYSIDQPAAWDNIQFTDLEHRLAEQAVAICFGTLAQRNSTSMETLRKFLSSSPTAVKVLDLNLRKPWPDRETVIWSLQQADILKCNDSELQMLAKWFIDSDPGTEIEIAARIQQIFALRCVFWTRGAQGCVWQSNERVVQRSVPVLPSAENADTVGAGDAACAALVIGVIENWSSERIVDVANLCGAYAASQPGATAPLPQAIIQQIFSG